MVLSFDDGHVFATGAIDYEYTPVTAGEVTNRIFLKVEIEGYPIEAVVDTGAPYVILAPSVARAIGFNPMVPFKILIAVFAAFLSVFYHKQICSILTLDFHNIRALPLHRRAPFRSS